MKRNHKDPTKVEGIFDKLIERVSSIDQDDLSFFYGDRTLRKEALERVRALALRAERRFRQRGEAIPPHLASAIAIDSANLRSSSNKEKRDAVDQKCHDETTSVKEETVALAVFVVNGVQNRPGISTEQAMMGGKRRIVVRRTPRATFHRKQIEGRALISEHQQPPLAAVAVQSTGKMTNRRLTVNFDALCRVTGRSQRDCMCNACRQERVNFGI
jgi:hypothetical protein